jgi:hypothetical protein
MVAPVNRWPDRGNTNGPGFKYMSHRHARIVRRLQLRTQPLFQFGTVTLNPTPDRRVIRFQTALGEQPFDIAQRERVPKTSARHTESAPAPFAAT